MFAVHVLGWTSQCFECKQSGHFQKDCPYTYNRPSRQSTISATSTTDTTETEDYTIQLPSTDTSMEEQHRECTPEFLRPSARIKAAVIRGDKALHDQSIGDGNIIDIQYLAY